MFVHQQTRAAYFGAPKIRTPLPTDISYSFSFSSLSQALALMLLYSLPRPNLPVWGLLKHCSRAPTAIGPEKK
jgi:hypothetical protein